MLMGTYVIKACLFAYAPGISEFYWINAVLFYRRSIINSSRTPINKRTNIQHPRIFSQM